MKILKGLHEIARYYGIVELCHACEALLAAFEQDKKQEKEKEKEGEHNEEAQITEGWNKRVNLKSPQLSHSRLSRDMASALQHTDWADVTIGGVPTYRALLRRIPYFANNDEEAIELPDGANGTRTAECLVEFLVTGSIRMFQDASTNKSLDDQVCPFH